MKSVFHQVKQDYLRQSQLLYSVFIVRVLSHCSPVSNTLSISLIDETTRLIWNLADDHQQKKPTPKIICEYPNGCLAYLSCMLSYLRYLMRRIGRNIDNWFTFPRREETNDSLCIYIPSMDCLLVQINTLLIILNWGVSKGIDCKSTKTLINTRKNVLQGEKNTLIDHPPLI